MSRCRVKGVLSTVLLAGVVLAIAPAARGGESRVLRNDAYTLTVGADGAVTVSAAGVSGGRVFRPVFVVLSRDGDPKVALRPGGIKGVSYNVPTWETGASAGVKDELGKVDTKVSAGDGFDNAILEGDRAGRTPDLFRAAHVETVTATGADVAGDVVRWAFAARADLEVSAELRLEAGRGEPRVTMRFTPRKAGWYSLGYAGAPEADVASIDEVWQPLIWTEKRFPDRSYLTAAFHCPVPAPMVTEGGSTYGLVVDPAELPFQPLPTFANSRFGVLVRNAAGRAQPMAFAPVLGGPGSHREAGEGIAFGFRLMVRPGSCVDAQEYVSREVYGFRDRRTNTTCTLNRTLENMVAYGMSPYSRFNEDLRGCAYDTDAPGTVKNVSALHPLSLALVTDDESIYVRRARPIMEFLLSREKFLFATNKDLKTQNPGWRLLGPCAPLSELVGLYLMTERRNPLLVDEAEAMLGQDRTLNLDEKQDGRRWPNYLAMYRATGRAEYLTQAKARADEYLKLRLDVRQTSFKDPAAGGMFFWSSFAPMWVDLLELYEETGEKRYLDAAHEGARRYCQYAWTCPAVPDGDVTVNEGGVAPEYWYLKARGAGPIKVPQETVPAWRVSEIGLVSESSGTSSGHRAVLLANHAPWMLRLARLTGDRYLHDVARWAVVGRYENFPGYHINTARTTVYEKADYPLRAFKELTYNSFHFNHIWPHIAMVVDYLVSDAYDKSDGAVDFPGRYAEGYAYIKSKVYGDRPGRFYGTKDVWLWMPKGLVDVDNVQVNYVAARGAEKGVYLALCNQSPDAVNVTVRLNKDLVELAAGVVSGATWADNAAGGAVMVADGAFTVRVSGGGITAVAIPGAVARAGFQAKVLRPGNPLPDQKSTARLADAGGVRGMLLSMGPDLTSAYVYLQATYEQAKAATLHYRTTDGGGWQTATDAAYPYEFTVPLKNNDQEFEFYVEATGVDGRTTRSATATMSR